MRWAGLIHSERGVHNIRCHVADGTAGFPGRAPYDRMVAWCTPPLLPKAWVDQVADDGLIVAPLPIAAVPNMTVVAKIRVREGEPAVEAVFTGGYIEATTSPKDNLDLPGRWVDWENRVPSPSWISLRWAATQVGAAGVGVAPAQIAVQGPGLDHVVGVVGVGQGRTAAAGRSVPRSDWPMRRRSG
ncbi:Protein-L-isoaspartate O-methyltransferase [Streptomyces hirsutus]